MKHAITMRAARMRGRVAEMLGLLMVVAVALGSAHVVSHKAPARREPAALHGYGNDLKSLP